MNKRRRVLVVENQRLVGAGIQHLLTGEAGLEVAGVAPEDEAALVAEIKRFLPDWVVLDQATTNANRLCRLLQGCIELHVAVVSANDDLIRIYEKRRITSAKAADLAALLRS
jgi:DNA-binding NarL/FixJ family response regulator